MSQFSLELRKMLDQLLLGEDETVRWVNRSKTIDSITRLPGDASTRRYYRIQTRGNRFILMKMESFSEHGSALPFLAMQRHLKASGVAVPEVMDTDPQRGFILLEDLGDETLLRRLQEAQGVDSERYLYGRAIDALVQLQIFGSRKSQSESLDAFTLRFDVEKLMWEVNFSIEHFYKIYLKREISQRDLQVFQEGFGEISEVLARQPVVLTHRDYHSRNIMIPSSKKGEFERFVMIDFQDARLGPPQYDLASLLRDSYYQLEDSQIQSLVEDYIQKFEVGSGEKIDRKQFLRVFDLMSVQRNFKAIGSFASFMNRRGDPAYLKFIGNTFENVRRTLLRYPEYTDLRKALFFYYYF